MIGDIKREKAAAPQSTEEQAACGVHEKPWYVYILRCSDGSLYTGITTELDRRVSQHNQGTGARYTRSRRPVQVVSQEIHPTRSLALKREAAIKAMTRVEKQTLVDASESSQHLRDDE